MKGKGKKKLKDKKNIEVIISLFLILLAFAMIGKQYGKDGDITAEILYDGEVVREFSLENDGVFFVDDVPAVIFEVKDQTVRFKQSDCPDQVCVKAGFLDKAWQSAACLPNKLTLQIIGEPDDENNPDLAP